MPTAGVGQVDNGGMKIDLITSFYFYFLSTSFYSVLIYSFFFPPAFVQEQPYDKHIVFPDNRSGENELNRL